MFPLNYTWVGMFFGTFFCPPTPLPGDSDGDKQQELILVQW